MKKLLPISLLLLALSTTCLFSQKTIKGGRIVDNPAATESGSLTPKGILFLVIIPIAGFVLYKVFNKKDNTENNQQYELAQRQVASEEAQKQKREQKRKEQERKEIEAEKQQIVEAKRSLEEEKEQLKEKSKTAKPANDVDINEVVSYLKKVKIPFKEDYDEKYIQAELSKYLKPKFEKVSREYPLQGHSSGQIDIDLGDGQIGIEVKLLKSVYTATRLNTLLGQIIQYKDACYKDNLIVVLAGESHLKENAKYEKVISDIKKQNAKCVYVEVLSS